MLHDIFAVPFDEIAPIVDRSTEARQLASRARRRSGLRTPFPTATWTPSERSSTPSLPPRASAMAGIVFGFISELIGCAILDGRGITTVLSSSDVLLLTLGGLAGVALWGAIGTALGAIIHNQVGAVITLLARGFVIDTLLLGLAPAVGRFVPPRARTR